MPACSAQKNYEDEDDEGESLTPRELQEKKVNEVLQDHAVKGIGLLVVGSCPAAGETSPKLPFLSMNRRSGRALDADNERAHYKNRVFKKNPFKYRIPHFLHSLGLAGPQKQGTSASKMPLSLNPVIHHPIESLSISNENF